MFNRSRALFAALFAAFGLAETPVPKHLQPRMDSAVRKPGPVRRRVMPLRNKYRPHEGKAEVARRRSQIERGILTRSNGLELRS